MLYEGLLYCMQPGFVAATNTAADGYLGYIRENLQAAQEAQDRNDMMEVIRRFDAVNVKALKMLEESRLETIAANKKVAEADRVIERLDREKHERISRLRGTQAVLNFMTKHVQDGAKDVNGIMANPLKSHWTRDGKPMTLAQYIYSAAYAKSFLFLYSREDLEKEGHLVTADIDALEKVPPVVLNDICQPGPKGDLKLTRHDVASASA